MPHRKFWFIVLIPVIAVAVLLISSFDTDLVEAGANDSIGRNVDSTAFLQSLEEAVADTDVDSIIRSSGTYVMFAPTNSAFAALPAGVINGLRAEPGLGTINYLMAYHVVENEALAITSFGEVTSAINGTFATINGVPVQITSDSTVGQQRVFVNGVEVIGFVPSSNGSIWLIGQVLVPPGIDLLDPQLVVTLEPTATAESTTVAAATQDAAVVPAETSTPMPTPTATPVGTSEPAATTVPTAEPTTNGDSIADIVISVDNLSTLESAVAQALLADELSFGGPFTVFAPTNDAFAALTAEQQAALAADPLSILQYHVVPGEVTAQNLVSSMTVPTLLGSAVQAEVSGTTVLLNGNAQVLLADVRASNGIVHVIDKVLFPPSVPVPQPQPDVTVNTAGTNLDVGREVFSRSEEIIVRVPDYEFPAGTNGSFRMQILQYPDGLDFAPVNYKDAQHWDSSGDIFVFGSLNNARLNTPSVFVITPFTYEVVVNETGVTEYAYTKIEGAPVFTSVNFSFVP